MHDPVVCKDGHTMCAKCLSQAISTGIRTCPVDRSFLGIRQPAKNLALQAMIQKLAIKYPNAFEAGGIGCSWTGSLGSAAVHSTTDCPMKMVGCPNEDCGVSVYKYELDSHMSKCPHKKTFCGHCHNAIKVAQSDEHLESCPKVDIRCPNNCGINILRDQVISHFYTCKAEPYICPMHCGQVLLPLQEPIENHFKRNTAWHLDETFSNLMRMREDKDEVPPLKVIDRAIFSWNVDKKHICDHSTVASPTLSSKLSTFQCVMKKQQIHIDLFIVTKNKMDLATMLTSGIIMTKTTCGQDITETWKRKVVKSSEAMWIKKFVSVGELPDSAVISFHIQMLI